MVAVGWLLDWAAKVPNLFVETSAFDAAKASIGSGKA